MALAKNKVMTQAQAKKILWELDNLNEAVVSTLKGFEAEDTDTYNIMFASIRKKIATAVGL